eukprot:TRINITY_DN1057_c0_g2_i1.p1 TRINITY_DN1057_c0_g2~~TRINITY_DN1057_c0_g2_i1.p1  ORF type:complete len:314 (-),score=70.20 TRINITY_DN1057_c0_g2_i1:139-1038(-)
MTETKPKWQSDAESPNCGKCGKEFTFFFRRHHCRGCGKVMCGDCTAKKCKLPDSFGYHGEERVCESCFEYLGVKHPHEDDSKAINIEEIKKNLFEKCLEVAEYDEKEWKVVIVKEDVEVATRNTIIDGHQSPFEAVRTRTLIPADFEKTKKICFDPQLWKEWTSDLKDFKLLEHISEDAEVWFEEYKVPVVEDRYVITLKMKYDKPFFKKDQETPTKTFSLLACSIPHPQAPKVSGVRGRLNYSITHVRAVERDGKEYTEFTAYGHFDPCGLLPPVLVNKLLSEAGHNIHLMSQYIKNH